MDGVQMIGVIGLAVVLVLVAGIAVLRRHFDGRIRNVPTAHAQATIGGGLLANRHDGGAAASVEMSLQDLGIAAPAGRVTVVQFTGEFCAVCPQARTLVERVLRDHPEIAHVELDVADHLEAVRTLDIRRTPTVLIVNAPGRVLHRVSGMPREIELRSALSDLVDHR